MPTIVYSIAGGFPPFIVEVIGEAVPLQYRASAGTYTIDLPECGTYTIRVTDAKDCVDEFTAVCPCPTTTTTTMPAPTTTTTTYEEYPCNFPISFYGTEFITIYDIFIGATTGWVTLEYNILNIPAKIIVEYGGAEVMNTTYRGNSSYQTALNTALTALGLPTEVINTDKESIEYYEKTDAGTYARVYIYSPIAGATINFRLRCPVDADFDVTYNGYICVEELATTTTTTVTSTTSTTTELPTTTTTTELHTTTTTTCVISAGLIEVLCEDWTTTEGILPLSHITRSTVYYPPCGLIYPYTISSAFSPKFVAGYYEPNRSYSEVDYIEITYVSIPAGMDVTYNGATVQIGDFIYASGSAFQWALGYVSVTRDAEGVWGDNITATIKFYIKLTRYQLTEEATCNLIFGGCFI